MKIYTSKLKNDDTAEATIQMTKAEFLALREFMKTPDEFRAVKLLHGVYINYRSNGWYVAEASNTYRAVSKIQASLSLLRKFAREVLGHEPMTPPRGVPFRPTVPVPVDAPMPIKAPEEVPPPVLHKPPQRTRGSSLFHSMFARI